MAVNAGKKSTVEKKPVKQVRLDEFLKLVPSIAGDTEKEGIRHNSTRHCIHHELVLQMPGAKPHNVSLKLPPMVTGYILRRKDEDSGRLSHKTFVPIYGNWPVGKNRGEDPRGDKLLDALKGLHKSYCEGLDANPLVKKRIYLDTKQPCVTTGLAEERVKSPVLWEVFDSKHERAGEIDDSKSPYFKIMLWEQELDANADIPPDALIVDEGRKKIITSIYDRTTKFENKSKIRTEMELSRFTYMPGDWRQGKFPFELFQQIDLLNPTVYWQKEKQGEFQIKCTEMNITQKIQGGGAHEKTPEEIQDMKREIMEAEDYYNVHKRAAAGVVDQPDTEAGSEERPLKRAKTAEEMEFESALAFAENQ
jgi:hypothetical protein